MGGKAIRLPDRQGRNTPTKNNYSSIQVFQDDFQKKQNLVKNIVNNKSNNKKTTAAIYTNDNNINHCSKLHQRKQQNGKENLV